MAFFKIKEAFRELEENNIRISCRTFVRIQGVIPGALGYVPVVTT